MFEQLDVLTGFALAGILAAQSRHGMPTPTAAAADALDYALAVRRVLSIRKAQEHRQLAEAVCASWKTMTSRSTLPTWPLKSIRPLATKTSQRRNPGTTRGGVFSHPWLSRSCRSPVMRTVRVLLAVLAIAGLTLMVTAQTPPSRGVLPRGWKALGLTDQQKAQVYEIEAKANAKILDLQTQIKAVKAQEQADLQKILTDAQKARLKEIQETKINPTPPAKPEPKKPEEKPPTKP